MNIVKFVQKLILKNIYKQLLVIYHCLFRESLINVFTYFLCFNLCGLKFFSWNKRWLLMKCKFCRLCIQNLVSGLLQAKNWKIDSDATIFQNDVIINFWRCFVFPVKFSYGSKFHFNIITGSGVMTIFLYQKSWNWKYPCLNFAQYLETGAS